MAIPTTRKTFRDYCLRKIGFPVTDINVDDDQVEDRIDEAINKYQQFHCDGSERLYMKHQITDQDKLQRYIKTAADIIGVVSVLDVASFNSSASLFNVNYQFALNDLFNIQATQMLPFYLALRHIDMLNYFFSTQPTIRFNYHVNRLYLDDWSNITSGTYLIIDCYRKINPEVYPRVWNDIWLQNYCTALLKKTIWYKFG